MDRGPAKPQPAEVYEPDQFHQLADRAKTPPPSNEHLFAAAKFMFDLLTKNGIPFALMGGLAFNVHGSDRKTLDVDIALDCNMRQARDAVRGNPRIRYPAGPGDLSLRVFVNTGGDHEPGLEPRLIEVDLILQGELGAPASSDLPKETEQKSVEVQGVSETYPVLGIPALAKAKFGANVGRTKLSDFRDLMFLFGREDYQPIIREHSKSIPLAQRTGFLERFQTMFPPEHVAVIKEMLGLQ